jgi:post-segregation antitoxin (ccd killing protein)
MYHMRRTSNKRRTTLTLPTDSLAQAERVARSRHVNLSTVVSEALSEGLKVYADAERSRQVLSSYQKAFSGFSAEELLALDGILLEESRPRRAKTQK